MAVPDAFSLFLALYYLKWTHNEITQLSVATNLNARKTYSSKIPSTLSFIPAYLSQIVLSAIFAKPSVPEDVFLNLAKFTRPEKGD